MGKIKYLLFFIAVLFLSKNASAQSISLAMNYVEQGEYEKAKTIYQKLYEKNPRKQDYLLGLADVYVQLEEFKSAESLIKEYIQKPGVYPNIMVELGYVYQRQKDSLNAELWYEKAIDEIEQRSVYAYTTGQAFQKHNLLDYAIRTYEIANKEKPRINYSIQLARIYGEKGNQKEMFNNYIKLIEENEKYVEVIQQNFNAYINENPQNENNVILKRLLLQRLQQSPDILYNQILSWVFIQEQDFDKAFAQERAIFKRAQAQSYNRLFNLAEASTDAEQFEKSQDIYNYIIDESENLNISLKAIENQMEVKLLQNIEYSEVDKAFQSHFKTYGYGLETFNLQLAYARFLAFNQNKWDKAFTLLEQTIDYNLNRFQNAEVQMLMADILVAQQQYNRALVKYSLVSKQLKNSTLAQEAQYKTAMTSYYKGDFSWALTQLDVLKKATTQTIANDALDMALFIKQGKSETDSTQQALKGIAKADLLYYQSKNQAALNQLDSVAKNDSNFHILDQVLYKKAQIFEKLNRFEEAAAHYKQLIDEHPKSIVIDNALFNLSKIQIDKLNTPDEAMKYLEMLIFNHQDSIFFVEARKLYRKIRGDQNLQ